MSLPPTEKPPASWRALRLSVRLGVAAVLALAVVVFGLWTFGALYYCSLPWPAVRPVLAYGFAAATVAAFLLRPRRRRTLGWFFGVVAVVAVWFAAIAPSNDRDWAPEYAVLPHAEIDGDRVTIHGIRDFRYRSETDYTPHYVQRTYGLDDVATADFVLSYWDGNRDIAHTLLTFGFDGGDHLTLSVETRRERGEGYSTTAGFYKQYELVYVLATERDLIGLRTNYRGEDVFLYPMILTRAQARRLFENTLERINSIYAKPEFYNALLHNCTTSLLPLADGVRRRPFAFDCRQIFNGYIDELGYELGTIVADESNGLPYEAMREKHAVTEVARRGGVGDDYSSRIRAALPARTR